MQTPATRTIFVRLLGEGLETARPAEAVVLPNGAYRILKPEDYDPTDEEWEFKPQETVLCEEVDWGKGRTLFLAVKRLA